MLKVTNYRFEVSGITERHLRGAVSEGKVITRVKEAIRGHKIIAYKAQQDRKALGGFLNCLIEFTQKSRRRKNLERS